MLMSSGANVCRTFCQYVPPIDCFHEQRLEDEKADRKASGALDEEIKPQGRPKVAVTTAAL